MYNCPVCGWPDIREDPSMPTHEMCDQCGVEYGYEPEESYPELRRRWIEAGRLMWRDHPNSWNTDISDMIVPPMDYYWLMARGEAVILEMMVRKKWFKTEPCISRQLADTPEAWLAAMTIWLESRIQRYRIYKI